MTHAIPDRRVTAADFRQRLRAINAATRVLGSEAAQLTLLIEAAKRAAAAPQESPAAGRPCQVLLARMCSRGAAIAERLQDLASERRVLEAALEQGYRLPAGEWLPHFGRLAGAPAAPSGSAARSP